MLISELQIFSREIECNFEIKKGFKIVQDCKLLIMLFWHKNCDEKNFNRACDRNKTLSKINVH